MHPFLRKLLHYYGIALCHLNPNSILHLVIFINLCEAYLGIDAHFNLFRYFFCLKPFSGSGAPKVVGCVYLVLWDGMASECITVPLNSSMKGWNARWFYTKNWEPSISAEIDQLAVPNANWTARPSSEEMNQVEELLSILKQTNVDGVGITLNFISRWLQSCKERVHPAYEYRDDDFAREAPEQLERIEVGL